MSVGLHVAVSAEALDRRLAEKDGESWDYFSDVERDMEDDAVRQRRERYYSKSASLLQSLSVAGKIRTVSANVSMDTCVSQAASMLSAAFAPVVALVIGGAGSGSSAMASKLAGELGWSHLSLDALPTMLMDAGQEAGLTACELLAAGKMLPQPVVLSLFKAAMAISGAPGYLLDGFPTCPTTFSRAWRVLQVSSVLHLDLSPELFEKRMADKDGDAWDCFNSVERDMGDDALKMRFQKQKQASAPLVEAARERGILHQLPAEDASVEKCVQLLSHSSP